MATATPNYSLRKPATSDFVAVITDINDNMDAVDTNLKRVDNAATEPPRCKVHQVQGSITALPGGWTALTWTGTGHEDFDTANFHDGTTNTDRMTVPSAGTYLLSGKVAISANATGLRGSRFTKNGAVIPGTSVIDTNLGGGVVFRAAAATTSVVCVAGDIIRMEAYQDSGVSLNSYADTEVDNASFFEIRKIAAT